MLMKKLAEAGKALIEALAETDAVKRESKVKEAQATIEALQKDLVKAGAAAPAPAPVKEAEKPTDAEQAKKDKEDKERKDKEAAAALEASPEAKEAHAFAVKALVKESGLSEKLFDMDDLTGMSFREAQKHVAQMKRVSEHNAAAILESLGGEASHGTKIHERAGAGVSNDDAFAGCTL